MPSSDNDSAKKGTASTDKAEAIVGTVDDVKKTTQVKFNENRNSLFLLSALGTDSEGESGTISSLYGPSVGAVVGEFKCSHANRRGTLHLTTKAACFRSTGFFGIEQSRVIVSLVTVATIVLTKDRDGICVTDNSGQVYEFVGLENRDAAFDLLLSLHKRVSNYSAQKDKDKDQSVSKSMKERRMSVLPGLVEEELGQKDTPTEDDILAAAVAANMVEGDSGRNLVKEIKSGKISDQGWATVKKYRSNDEVPLPIDLRKKWEELRDAKEPSFNEVVIKDLKLSCTLDEYFEFFLANDAERSIAAFQRENRGDSDHEVSPWQLSEEDGFSLNRLVSYIHPVNVPMAPPKVAASKEQSFRRFGDYGICVETQTVVKDVPMTDCFYVDDRIMLEPMPEGGICLTAQFEVRFVKKTMFRSMIVKNTSVQYGSWFQEYKTFILDGLKEKSKGKERGIVEEEEGRVEEKNRVEEERTRVEEEKGEGVEAQVETVEEQKRTVTLAPASLSPVDTYVLALVGLVTLLVVMQFLLMMQVRALSAKQERIFQLLAHKEN